MSKVLLLSIPSHGHMNPLLGLAAELVNQGEQVTFFSSDEFKRSIEDIGAEYKSYKEDLNVFQKKADNKNNVPSDEKTPSRPKGGLISAFLTPSKFIDDVLDQVKDVKFDYIVFSAAYPYASTIAQILNIPAISSYAVYITLKELMGKSADTPATGKGPMGLGPEIMEEFKKVREGLIKKYDVKIPENIMDLLYNKGDLNIIYTSKYFIRNIADYDDSFIFIGPPIYNKKYNVDFPFEKLEGKKVIYISMGSIFGNHSAELNKMFFEAFGNTDFVVVMAAHNVDVSQFTIPDNFIVRGYVPQLDVLKRTSVAITHAGMNSIGDLLYNNIPFISIPLGADQFYLANRAMELGATIVLDSNNLSPDILNSAVKNILTDPSYNENSKKISDSFKEAGGYKKAVAEIFKVKKQKGISN